MYYYKHYGIYLSIVFAFMVLCIITEVYHMDPIAQIISIVGFIVTIISLFISNHLEFKLSRKLFRLESEETLNVQNWIEFRTSIKQIAGKLNYILRRTTMLAQDENIDATKRTQYRLEVLDASFDMNADLLRYHDLLEKIGYQGSAEKTVYDDYYRYVMNKLSENETIFLAFLDDEKANPFHPTICNDNALLTKVITDSDKDYQRIVEAIGNRNRKH